MKDDDTTMDILTDAADAMDRLLPIDAVAEVLSITRGSVYRMIHMHGFPRPVKIGNRSRWRQSEVLDWLNTRPRMTTRPSRKPPNRP